MTRDTEKPEFPAGLPDPVCCGLHCRGHRIRSQRFFQIDDRDAIHDDEFKRPTVFENSETGRGVTSLLAPLRGRVNQSVRTWPAND